MYTQAMQEMDRCTQNHKRIPQRDVSVAQKSKERTQGESIETCTHSGKEELDKPAVARLSCLYYPELEKVREAQYHAR